MLDTTLETLSELYLQMGNYQHAEPVLKELITIRERTKGPNDPILGKTVVEYTQVLRSLGRTAEADRLEVKANAILNRTLTAHWNCLTARDIEKVLSTLSDPAVTSVSWREHHYSSF